MARRVHHDERAHLFAGTAKGIFVYDGDIEREKWKRTGRHLVEHVVHSIAYDYRDEESVYVATSGGLFRTQDFGKSWDRLGQELPADDVTHVAIGHQSASGTLWVGLRPAGLAHSGDGGKTFRVIEGLDRIPSRGEWWAAGGEPEVHSVVVHPVSRDTLHLGINVAGVFRTEDGGNSWTAANQGLEPSWPAGGHQHDDAHREVFRLVSNPARPEQLFAVARGGVYRTQDSGASWQDMGEGLPSRAVRSIVVSPSRPGMIFVVPLADAASEPPRLGGELVAYRSSLGGEMWDRLEEGLDQEPVSGTIHREAMAFDDIDVEGVYLGTGDGKVYVSLDDGESWLQIARGLAPVRALAVVLESPD